LSTPTNSQSNNGAELRIGDQLIRHYRDLTVSAYLQMQIGMPEHCACAMCRNFIAQRSTAYPGFFLDLLAELGIDPTKENEVYSYGAIDDNPRIYEGWLFFAGDLLEQGQGLVDNGGFKYWIGSHHRPPKEVDFGGRSLVVEFSTTLPWVIPDIDDSFHTNEPSSRRKG
jgi:hypothetical protein